MAPPPLAADLSQAAQLLELLAGDGPITFQTFDDTAAKRKGLTRIRHGTLQQHASELSNLNMEGASITFMVNAGDGRGRRAANVTHVRALFVDLDGAPIEPVRNAVLQPHAIVESSSGRFHAYWAVSGVELQDFSPLQRAIAERFDGDRSVVDLPRVMRLPGTWHHKQQPTLCKMQAITSSPPYTRDQVIEMFGRLPPCRPRRPKPEPEGGVIELGNRNNRLFELARGFVNKGLAPDQVQARISSVNRSKCAVPLPDEEVAAVVSSAVAYGPAGHLNLPVQVFDSPVYRALSHAARTVAAAAYRRYNGSNNGNISLPFSDFQAEFRRRESFYRARAEVVASGLLRIVRKHSYDGWAGRRPDLFEVALRPPSESS